MPKYRRNIRLELTLLRGIFLSGLCLCCYLFLKGKTDYSFILLFLLACGSVVPVTRIILTESNINICRYYVYGLIPRSWNMPISDNIEILQFDLEVSDAGYLNTDSWWDIFTVFMPVAKATVKKFVLKHTDNIGNKFQIKIRLNNEELNLIEKAISQHRHELT